MNDKCKHQGYGNNRRNLKISSGASTDMEMDEPVASGNNNWVWILLTIMIVGGIWQGAQKIQNSQPTINNYNSPARQ